LYRTGEYSDLIISCGGTDYRVHRSIICPRSHFFAAACRNGFKEARTGKIILSDDDAQAVDLTVYYFYHLNYDPSHPREQPRNIVDNKDTGQTGASEDPPRKYPPGSDLVTHTKVYALAEKYLINGLKALALRKFNEAAAAHWACDEFLEAAQVAYESTVETDRGMRDAVVQTFYIHPELLDKEEVQGLFMMLPLLSYDLMMMHVRSARNWTAAPARPYNLARPADPAESSRWADKQRSNMFRFG
ncbi:hypothetical protein PG985_009522, partial [Apiospora marii]